MALLGTIVTLVASLGLSALLPSRCASQFQFECRAHWLAGTAGFGGASYHIGIDGIGLLMVLMTTIIFPFVVGVSMPAIKERTKMFYFLVLFVETAILGTFVSIDLILFYIFYEAMLIPIYFLIGIWGGEKRVYATMKFFLYTMVGSMLMLVSIISMYFMVGSFDLPDLQQKLPLVLGRDGLAWADRGDVAVPGLLCGIWRESAYLAAAHLGAGRVRGSPDRGDDYPWSR